MKHISACLLFAGLLGILSVTASAEQLMQIIEIHEAPLSEGDPEAQAAAETAAETAVETSVVQSATQSAVQSAAGQTAELVQIGAPAGRIQALDGLSDIPAGAPAAEPETSAPQPETSVPQPETSVPQPETSAPQPETSAPQPETSAPQPETAAAVPETPPAPQETYAAPVIYAGSAGGPGSMRQPVGVSLVFPNVATSMYKTAQGSVQLSDGSWSDIGLDKFLYNPFYLLLREQTDRSGTAWYVCRVSANKIGNYYVPDGSKVSELWLKKSDCDLKTDLILETGSAKRAEIVKTAISLLGSRYQYAGSGPDSFDCSGFVNYVMNAAGISVPRSSYQIVQMENQVGINELKPGDITARSGHVGIYVGQGMFVHACDDSTGVVSDYLENYNRRSPFTNYINILGD